jgi:hypothetical protein
MANRRLCLLLQVLLLELPLPLEQVQLVVLLLQFSML